MACRAAIAVGAGICSLAGLPGFPALSLRHHLCSRGSWQPQGFAGMLRSGDRDLQGCCTTGMGFTGMPHHGGLQGCHSMWTGVCSLARLSSPIPRASCIPVAPGSPGSCSPSLAVGAAACIGPDAPGRSTRSRVFAEQTGLSLLQPDQQPPQVCSANKSHPAKLWCRRSPSYRAPASCSATARHPAAPAHCYAGLELCRAHDGFKLNMAAQQPSLPFFACRCQGCLTGCPCLDLSCGCAG